MVLYKILYEILMDLNVKLKTLNFSHHFYLFMTFIYIYKYLNYYCLLNFQYNFD